LNLFLEKFFLRVTKRGILVNSFILDSTLRLQISRALVKKGLLIHTFILEPTSRLEISRTRIKRGFSHNFASSYFMIPY
jgi:hypothetical protein